MWDLTTGFFSYIAAARRYHSADGGGKVSQSGPDGNRQLPPDNTRWRGAVARVDAGYGNRELYAFLAKRENYRVLFGVLRAHAEQTGAESR